MAPRGTLLPFLRLGPLDGLLRALWQRKPHERAKCQPTMPARSITGSVPGSRYRHHDSPEQLPPGRYRTLGPRCHSGARGPRQRTNRHQCGERVSSDHRGLIARGTRRARASGGGHPSHSRSGAQMAHRLNVRAYAICVCVTRSVTSPCRIVLGSHGVCAHSDLHRARSVRE